MFYQFLMMKVNYANDFIKRIVSFTIKLSVHFT